MAETEDIGARIRRYRQEREMTATQLAGKAGISKSYLSELESPKDGTKQPSADKLYAIAKALGVAMSDLLGRPIIVAPQTEAPASLRKFAEDHPQVPQGDIEMLSQIQFRGEAPESPERWEFIYQAIRNSRSMDG